MQSGFSLWLFCFFLVSRVVIYNGLAYGLCRFALDFANQKGAWMAGGGNTRLGMVGSKRWAATRYR